MTIAVTGGTGFVGQALLERVLAAGKKVRALTRRKGGAADDPQPLWIEGTLADPAALVLLCDGAEVVIHIAGAVNLPTRAEFAQVNVAGTQAVVDAAKAAGVRRFVHVSSLSAREPGLSDYGWSKAGAEDVVCASGLDWAIVRPPAIYGPRDTEILELFKPARFGVVPLPPPGRVSMLHVDDLARLLLALAAPDAPSRMIYEPDDGHAGGWAHRELALLIGKAMGRRVWAPHVPAGALLAAARIDERLRGRRAKLTCDRARYMAHPDWVSAPARAVPPDLWQPQIATPEGFGDTVRWYRAHGWL